MDDRTSIREEFEGFLGVDEEKAQATVSEMMRVLARMERRGFDILKLSDEETAEAESRRYLRSIHKRGPGERKNNVIVINAIARWKAHDYRFPQPKRQRSVPKTYTNAELDSLRAYTTKDALATLRDRALVEFALGTGMRRTEVARFNASDFDADAGTIHVRAAKYGLVRRIPVDSNLLAERGPFRSWLRARPHLRDEPEAVWLNFLNGRANGRLTPEGVGTLMSRIGRDCSIRASFVRSRHTRATELLRRGAKWEWLQRYLGHADIQSTAVYAHYDEADFFTDFSNLKE